MSIIGRIWRIVRDAMHVPSNEEVARANLNGIVGAVNIREPNGSRHCLQNYLEQCLTKVGMALYTLPNRCADKVLQEGVWGEGIPESIQIAVVGIVKTEIVEIERYKEDKPKERYSGGYISLDRPPSVKYVLVTDQLPRYTIDLRFYGRDGAIHGAYHNIVVLENMTAWLREVDSIVKALAESGWDSLGAHN